MKIKKNSKKLEQEATKLLNVGKTRVKTKKNKKPKTKEHFRLLKETREIYKMFYRKIEE